MTYLAEFRPQEWINDVAYGVDPRGPTRWDATEFVETFLREPDGTYTVESAARWLEDTLEHGDYDDILRTDPNAPEWVREWDGPFDTYLEVVA